MKRSDGEVSDSSQLAAKTQKLAVRTSAGVGRYSYIQLCTIINLILKKTGRTMFCQRKTIDNKKAFLRLSLNYFCRTKDFFDSA